MMLNWFQFTNISLYCRNFFFLLVFFTFEAFNAINCLQEIARMCKKSPMQLRFSLQDNLVSSLVFGCSKRGFKQLAQLSLSPVLTHDIAVRRLIISDISVQKNSRSKFWPEAVPCLLFEENRTFSLFCNLMCAHVKRTFKIIKSFISQVAEWFNFSKK